MGKGSLVFMIALFVFPLFITTGSTTIVTSAYKSPNTEITAQIANASVFYSRWNTYLYTPESPGTSVELPLHPDGIYNFTIDWGDGISERITNADLPVIHYYPSGTTYDMQITGKIEGWSFNNGGASNKLIEILQWGCLNLGNSGGYFWGSRVDITATDALNLTGTYDMSNAFRHAEITSGDSFSNWDTSNITNMAAMFQDNSYFNHPLGSWNTSSVTDMSYMFRGDWSFDQDISNWNTSSVTDMSHMFESTSALSSSLNDWDTSKVTTMSSMFQGNRNFNKPIGNWNTSSVADMSWMFIGTYDFNQPIGNWNTSSVTDMNRMFNMAESFNQPLNNWDVSNVVNMGSMFNQALLFNRSLNNWNISSVSDMSWMFSGTNTFNQPLDTWNMSNVDDAHGMFSYAIAFNQPLNGWDISNLKDMQSFFNHAVSFNQPLDNWDVIRVRSTYAMFQGASAFNQPLNNWNFTQLFTSAYMFDGATSFDQPLGSWYVKYVSSMNGMFSSIALSTVNYDNLLIGWSNQSLRFTVNFDGGNSQYGSDAVEARQYMVDFYNWNIIDGGPAPEYSAPSPPIGVIGAQHSDSIDLSWGLPSNNGGKLIQNYIIYRSTDGNSYEVVGNVTTLFFTDIAISSGDTYYYSIAAENEIGIGTTSDPLMFTIPSNVTTTAPTSSPPASSQSSITTIPSSISESTSESSTELSTHNNSDLTSSNTNDAIFNFAFSIVSFVIISIITIHRKKYP